MSGAENFEGSSSLKRLMMPELGTNLNSMYGLVHKSGRAVKCEFKMSGWAWLSVYCFSLVCLFHSDLNAVIDVTVQLFLFPLK